MERHRSALMASAAIAPLLCSAGLAVFREGVTAAAAALVLVIIVVAAAATGERHAKYVSESTLSRAWVAPERPLIRWSRMRSCRCADVRSSQRQRDTGRPCERRSAKLR